MRMPVVQVRIVWMFVEHRRVPVAMRVRLARRIVRPMSMPVMFIVLMPMLMRHLGMPVLVLRTLGDMQIDAKCHQCASSN